MIEEIWKSLDFLGYPDYEVSNFGNVKSLNYKRTGKERILKPRKNNKGYLYVNLCKNGKGKSFLVHRLIAKCFLEPIKGKDIINHIDENPSNNHVSNLEYCTIQYNVTYNDVHIKRGEKYKGKNNWNYGKHLTEETKQKISKVMSGKPKSEEHKLKLSKPKSEETKKKMSKAMLGKPKYKLRKPILQFTKDMVFVREFDSATTASKELNLNQGSITQCCKKKRKTCGGFIWRYKE